MMMIDIHCHFVPDRTVAMLAGTASVRVGTGAVTHGGRTLPLPAALSDRDAFDTHRENLQLAVVSPPPGLYLESLLAEQPDYARAVNDDLAGELGTTPGIGVLGWLPLGSPGAALAAIAQVKERGNVVGFTMGTAHAAALADAAYDTVWHALSDAGLALQLHPDSDPYQSGARGTPNASILGFPAATAAAIVRLLMEGDGFWASGTRLCLVHGGGFLPLALPRLARAAPGQQSLVAQRVAILYADALVFGDTATRLVEETYAPGHVMPGSDWPFPIGLSSGLPPRDDWREALAGWSPRAAALILATTPRKAANHD
jgi:aminocarboxymuconate-semialdehyde decarboxylase